MKVLCAGKIIPGDLGQGAGRGGGVAPGCAERHGIVGGCSLKGEED